MGAGRVVVIKVLAVQAVQAVMVLMVILHQLHLLKETMAEHTQGIFRVEEAVLEE